MSDTERVFALFVQANPVPEPELLSASRDEAELPAFDWSTAMDDTATEIRERRSTRTPRVNPAAAVAGAFVVVIAIVGAVLLLRGEAGPVAAADAQPVITCDENSCSYDGPTSIFEGRVELTLENNSDGGMTLVLWKMSGTALDDELKRLPVGSEMALAPGDPTPDGALAVMLDAAAGETATETWLVTPGTHLVDSVSIADAGFYNDYAWRVAEIEILEP